MTMSYVDLAFCSRSMHDYHEDRAALVDLFRRCDATNRMSASKGATNGSFTLFHCEFIDYLRCMEQYSESYCYQLVQPADGRIVAAIISNSKQVHFGPHVFTFRFGRLLRVEPTQRRQYLAVALLEQVTNLQLEGVDCHLGYMLATNGPALAVQNRLQTHVGGITCQLNIFVVPTMPNAGSTRLYKLSQAETEQMWIVHMADWVQRPILSDLRHIMQMSEYIGTFAVGDLASNQYAVASVWQPLNAIICDDRPNTNNSYHGPYRLVFNFFQSSTATACTNDEKELLLSALSNVTAIDAIPFMLCHVDQSSPFDELCRQRALAMTTESTFRRIFSQRMADLGDKFDKSPVWLDPRDFSSLLYFGPLSEKVQSRL